MPGELEAAAGALLEGVALGVEELDDAGADRAEPEQTEADAAACRRQRWRVLRPRSA